MIALDLCRPHYQVSLITSEKRHSDKCKDCKSELDYMSVKDNQFIFQRLERSSSECNSIECKNNYNKDCSKELLKDLQTHTNFAMETINLFCY